MVERCNKRNKMEMCEHDNTYNLSVNGSTEQVEEEDGISSLPDSLLITILSFLPIDSAAATSVLSWRWRHLWTHLTRLSFHFETDKNSESFDISTATHILSQLKSPQIHTFELHLPFEKPPHFTNQVESSVLVPLIHQTCLRNPETLRLLRVSSSHSKSAPFYKVPACILQTHSLVRLVLCFRYFYVIPDDNGLIDINLPNLKILKLALCDSLRPLMPILFKSCPLLEELCLSLELFQSDHFINVVAPNLKHLDVITSGPFDKPLLSKDCRISIDAPKLESFEAHGNLVSFQFADVPRELKKVFLSSFLFFSNAKYCVSEITSLLQGIYCARSLTLASYFEGLPHPMVSVPCFHNLITLNFDCGWFETNARVPNCLLSNVKQVKVESLMPNKLGFEFLRGILSHAPVLEQLDISLYYYEEEKSAEIKDKLWMEYKFCTKLFKFPRSSAYCRIRFFGYMISGSSEDFLNGKFTCQLEGLDDDADLF